MLTALWMAAPALAQVVVDPLTEYAREEGLGVDLQARFGLAAGNAELIDLGAEGAVHWSQPFADEKQPVPRDPKKHGHRWYRDRFIMYGSYGLQVVGFGDAANVVLDNKLFHVRYTRMLIPRLGIEAFGQAGDDVVLKLDLRLVGGAGVRVVPLETDRLRIWAGAGYMVEYEDRAEGIDPERIRNDRWTTYASFDLVLVPDHLDLLASSYVLPRWSDLRDVQVLEETKLRVRVAEGVALGLSGRFRLDTQPPAGTRPFDVRVTNTIEVHL